MATLIELMAASTATFADVLTEALPALAAAPARPAGTMFRLERG